MPSEYQYPVLWQAPHPNPGNGEDGKWSLAMNNEYVQVRVVDLVGIMPKDNPRYGSVMLEGYVEDGRGWLIHTGERQIVRTMLDQIGELKEVVHELAKKIPSCSTGDAHVELMARVRKALDLGCPPNPGAGEK